MGCTDRFSNFEHYVFSDGDWGVTWGSLKFEAPTEEILRNGISRFGRRIPPDQWNVTEDPQTHTWTAKPLRDPQLA